MYKFCVVLILVFSLQDISPVDIAITIDDHPAVTINDIQLSVLFTPQARTDTLIDSCNKHQCKAAFFCIGKCCIEQSDPRLLSSITQNGHFIANHSFNHQHFSSMSAKQLEADVKCTEAVLKPYNMQLWFRYPYLDYGNRRELGGSFWKAVKGYRLLKKLGYKEGYVTIDTLDWHLNAWLVEGVLQKKDINYEALKELYVKLVKEWCFFNINYYNSLGFSDITHTLLLHANDLNALFLDDILAMIKQEGWTLVSPEKAFTQAKWRKQFAKMTKGKYEKPPTLNTKSVDEQINEWKVFS